MKKNCGWSRFAWLLVIIGAINWGLVGLGYFFDGNWNVVNLLLGRFMLLEAIVYILVGISGVILIFGCRCKTCKTCKTGTAESVSHESHNSQM